MAHVFGEAGRYVSQEATRKRHQLWGRGVIVVSVASVISGFLFRDLALFQSMKVPPLVSEIAPFSVLLLLWFGSKWMIRKLDALDKERLDMRRGAAGEAAVADVLNDFPDEFHVINDLTTPFGNVDHVVVGPTGVFLLDTKNWRGVVSAAPDGELLCNGKATDKPYVRQFVGRIMGIKDRVKVLATGLDPYFQALFVFISARVDAHWGTTKNAHCLRDDQLFDYIVNSQRGTRLTKGQIETMAQAFLGLAHMDQDFTAKAPPPNRPQVPAIVSSHESKPGLSQLLLAPTFSRSHSR
jgi:hypothetical protein